MNCVYWVLGGFCIFWIQVFLSMILRIFSSLLVLNHWDMMWLTVDFFVSWAWDLLRFLDLWVHRCHRIWKSVRLYFINFFFCPCPLSLATLTTSILASHFSSLRFCCFIAHGFSVHFWKKIILHLCVSFS